MENNGLAMESFATLTALKGEQFNKEIFSALLTFKELSQFLQVFPEVQRTANGRKINSIKRYVLTGLDAGQMRFFSSLTATARGNVFYDDATKRMAINTKESKLSVNDGQHRSLGIIEAIKELKSKQHSKRTSAGEVEELTRKIEFLEGMTIPVVIFNNISVEEEKQLFFDMNNLSSKPSRSTTIRLSQSDLLSKLAREVSSSNEYLELYGVEFDKTNIREGNVNNILLTTVYECCRLVATHKLGSAQELSNENYDAVMEMTSTIFDNIFVALPKDIDVKGRYITSKGFVLRALFTFVLRKMKEDVPQEKIYHAILKQNWYESLDVWGKYGGKMQQQGTLTFVGYNGGLNSVIYALDDQLAKM